ncbi:MAG: hypothetical protein LDLANPLL_01571 [Turneriella sp.]|nr:hypothetical protein [Turneriella sp.]
MQFHEKYGEKIVALLEKQITQGSILHIDETTMQVMREENRKNTTKSYAWTFSGGNAVLFTYRPTREAKFIYDILENYRGAEAACMFYSLVETAKVNGHDPFAYLVNLFKALPYAENDGDIERLMPYNQRP